MMIV